MKRKSTMAPLTTKRELFERLEREGKLEFAQSRYEYYFQRSMSARAGTHGPKVRYAEQEALLKLSREFPLDLEASARNDETKTKLRELDLLKRELLKSEVRGGARERQGEAEEASRRSCFELMRKQLRGKTEVNEELPGPIGWAWAHAHLIGDVSDASTWGIEPKEAPDSASWNMLMYAVENRKEFFSRAFSEMMNIQKERQRRADAERDWERKQEVKERVEVSVQGALNDPDYRDPMLEEIELMLTENRRKKSEGGDDE